MKSKSLIALSVLCLALGACASTDTATDPNIASPEDHANQTSAAARQDDVSYSTLTPNTEQTTVTTATTEPVWNASVQNPPADSSLTQNGSSTTVTGSGTTMTDNTASISGTTSTTTGTSTTSTSTPGSMTSSSTVDDDDDTTTATETRTRLRKD
jgi:mucin-2